MTPRAPRFQLTRVANGEGEVLPEIVQVQNVPLDTVMNRRGALGVGVSAAAVLAALGRLDAQAVGNARNQGRAEPRAPYPMLPAHVKAISALCLVPRADLIASASADNVVKLWSLADGRLVTRLDGHTDDVNALVCTPDGSLMASASNDATVRLWSLPQGTPGPVLLGHQAPVQALALAPDARFLVTFSADGTARIWSMPAGKLYGMLTLQQRSIQYAAFSADSKTLYTASQFDEAVASWAFPTGTQKGRIARPRSVSAFAFMPDGGAALYGTAGKVVVQNIVDGSVVREITLVSQGAIPQSLTTSPNGELIAAGTTNGSVVLASANDGSTTATLQANRALRAIAFSSDGQRLITGDANGSIALWDVGKAAFVRYLVDEALANRAATSTVRAHRSKINALVMSADGAKLASVSDDKTAKVWSVPQGQLTAQFFEHKEAVTAIALVSSGQSFITASADGTLMGWPIANATAAPTETRSFAGAPTRRPGVPQAKSSFEVKRHSQRITTLALSADAKTVATGAADRKLELSAADDGKALATFEGFERGIENLAYSPDGSVLSVTSGENTARLWLPEEQRLFAELTGTAVAREVAWSPDGKTIAVGRENGAVEIWAVADARVIARYSSSRSSSSVSALTFTHDGSRIVAGYSDGTLLALGVTDARLLTIREAATSRISLIAISRDDKTLFSVASSSDIKVWDLPDHRLAETWDGHTMQITTMLLSADGKWLATGDYAGVLALWDLGTRKLHSYCFDPAATDTSVRARSYNVLDKVTGQTVTYTLPCGSPLPANATCVCNCVPGTASVPRPSGGRGGGGTICTCNRVCTCVPVF